MDVFITTLSNEKYALYRNNGDLSFTYATNTSAVGQITLLYSGWGARFVDVDNDGLRDLFVAQSHVLDTIEKTTSLFEVQAAAAADAKHREGIRQHFRDCRRGVQFAGCGAWSGVW